MECFWRPVCGEVKRERAGRRELLRQALTSAAASSRSLAAFRTAAARTFTRAISSTRHERPPVAAELHGRRPLVVAPPEEDPPEICPQSLYVASLQRLG
jgi:hypothetical protein